MAPTKYLFATPSGVVPVPDELWDKPLSPSQTQKDVTLRDYFKLLDAFFQKRKDTLLRIYNKSVGKIRIRDFNRMEIVSEKLGTFYQIARCIFRSDKGHVDFCASTATRSQELLKRDFQNLCLLTRKLHVTFVPVPFLFGSLPSAPSAKSHLMAISVTQWLNNHWEWHLRDDIHICLWVPGKGEVELTTNQCLALFKGIGFCLALSVDANQLCHIWLWSNCAGDFIASPQGHGRISVKLTTVRFYGSPWVEFIPENSSNKALAMILYHFLDTALTVRIDRKAGTGSYLFACKALLKDAMEGYLDGLWSLELEGRLPQGTTDTFLDLVSSLDISDLMSIYEAIIHCHTTLGRVDASLMAKVVKKHCRELMDVVAGLEVPRHEQAYALGQA